MDDVHHVKSIKDFQSLVRSCPVIDNHAHNLLRPHALKNGNLLTLTTEAEDEALEDTPTSLAHIRAAKQLCILYDLPKDSDWETIVKKRRTLLDDDPDALIQKCLEGTQTLLIDDGLAVGDKVEPYHWHDRYTGSRCKRIVRIEATASDILSTLHQQNQLPVGVAVADEEACSLAWLAFITAFEQAIAAAIDDPEVVGFKSVICYRTGLDVHVGKDLDVTEDGLRSFRKHFLPECVARKFRVEAKGMNNALIISTCKLIAAGYRQHDRAKPFQFHTGLGDNDIHLLSANPAHLQDLIKSFPTVPIVLLHSSYPYTREAGYLATVYKNCYLDLGEVFPMVSRHGQEEILRQAFELTPWSKLLWSTDGHFHPETFWLANVQGREAFEKVVLSLLQDGDDFASVQQAAQAVKDIFFQNANRLYDLRLKFRLRSASVAEGPKLVPATEKVAVTDSAPVVEAPPVIGNGESMTASSRVAAWSTNIVDSRAVDMAKIPYNISEGLESFLSRNENVKFIFVQWLDYLGQMRTRCLSRHAFTRLIHNGERIRISNGNLGTLQNDHFTPVCNPVGAICVESDVTLFSLRPMQSSGPLKDSATVMARFVDETSYEPLDLCPRAGLESFTEKFRHEYKVDFLVGFEIEITFCKRVNSSEDVFQPLDTTHAWGTFLDEQYTTSFPLMTSIMSALHSIGIEVEQMHSEAGPGQYEFVLPPLPPVQAVDTLVQARQCIMQIAATRHLRATCYPTPFPGVGTAAHAHISFNSIAVPRADLEKMQMSFTASILNHLPALCAFTMPQAASYGRIIDSSWCSGTWVAWGTQNREVPIRKSASFRWEIRCLDGCANMYLALAALFAAGLRGVREGVEMKLQDCPHNPATLTADERQALGIGQKLPTSVHEALGAVEEDSELAEALAPGVLMHYVTMKKAEQAMLGDMSEKDRRVWLMERY